MRGVAYIAHSQEWLCYSEVVDAAGEDLRGVGWVGAAVPEQERSSGCVALRRQDCLRYRKRGGLPGVELFAEDAAADFEGVGGVAEGGEERFGEAVLAGGLSHDLHEAPTEAAGVGFRSADLIIGVERGDIFGEEKWFVAERPGIPGGFLFADGADQGGVEGVSGGGFAGQGDELSWSGHGRQLSGFRFRLSVREERNVRGTRPGEMQRAKCARCKTGQCCSRHS